MVYIATVANSFSYTPAHPSHNDYSFFSFIAASNPHPPPQTE